jgi:hypothetical protein
MNSADRSTATRQIHRYSLLTVIALLFAVPACGSSDVGQRTITEPVSEPASNGTSTSTTTTNTTGQPSTTERPLSEENTRDLALAATTNEEDFDRGWSKYSTPDGHTREPSKCAEEADSVLNKNAIHHGPTMEFLGGLAFFTTEARVFSSEDEASTWLTAVVSDAPATCIQQERQAVHDGNSTGVVVSVEPRALPAAGENPDGYLQVALTDDSGERLGQANYSYYQNGRVVTRGLIEFATISEADLARLSDDSNAALSAANERVNSAG